MKKAVCFNPYLDTLGGGEKYLISVACVLRDVGFQVEVLWHDEQILSALVERFDLDLEDIQVNTQGYDIFMQGSYIEKMRYFSSYDLFFCATDGSVPYMWSKNNVLHFQVPFTKRGDNLVLSRIKFSNIDAVVCNSSFTKRVVDETFSVDSLVIEPPATMFSSKRKKKKQILSVGRFDNLMHSKRQDKLIEAYSKLQQSGWGLILAGGLLEKNSAYLKLSSLAKAHGVTIISNPPFDELKDLYETSSIYWHAAGYGLDQRKNPEKVEHFGISTVEAMSAGQVPLVYPAGGQLEIVDGREYGYFWKSTSELASKTKKLIDSPTILKQMSQQSAARAQEYSFASFKTKIRTYVES